ncbi:PAS domain-containing protein [Verrucomicrobium sp. BvORR106]|uniref:PAS domain-containing sensor histidine kinase n=1 Tax=Verrucomicrobium sp. BvORR106 TaxID=1403819 RepID=UPI00068B5253|nr:PAS domain-containing protein [Verrucomicrobium sp. BvORR106]
MSASTQNRDLPPRIAETPPDECADARARRHSEAYLAAAQKLSRTGSFGWKIPSGEVYWSEETFRIYEYATTTRPTLDLILQRVHPDDAEMLRQTIERITQNRTDFDFEFRLLMPDGAVKYLRAVAHPESEVGGGVEFVGAIMDVTEAKEAEERIRLIINTVPAQIWTADADGQINFISQRLLDYFGSSLEEAGRQEPGLYAHPEEAADFLTLWHTKIAEEKPFEWEMRLRSSSGDYRWFLSRASPLFDRNGNISGWYGNNVDIHERKLAEEKLRETQAYLTEAQRLSGTGSFAWNPHTGKVLYWSHECYFMLGFDEREGIPPFESFLNRIHPDDRAGMVGPLERAIRDQSDFNHSYRVILPNGECRDIQGIGHPVFNTSGELVKFVGSVVDNTERNRSQAAIRSSEERFRLIVDNIPGLLCTHTAEGALEFANQRLLDYTGRTQAAIQQWDWVSLIHPDDLPETLQLWAHSCATGDPYSVEHRTRGADGVYRWFHVCGLPLRGEGGRIVRWYILLTAIDDRKKSEEALSKAQMELAHITRLTTMGELTASIAHEVNQPLAAVVNNANACLNLLQAGAPDLGEARVALAEIVEDADRAGAVLSRIRQMVKRSPLAKTSLDMRTVIADVLLLARGQSVARSVAIRTELPDETLPVLGDRVQLQQVLLNLVVNAMDAMKAVEIPERSLLIRARREDRRGNYETWVSVQDSGTGFASEDMDSLFNAFYTTKPQGMGMGLSISRSIVEAHGGRLWAEQNERAGATFTFNLPGAGTNQP